MTAAQPPPRAPAKQPLVTKYHVEVLAGEDSTGTQPLANSAAPTAGQAAAAEAAAAVEDDEPMLEEPQAETKMSEAKAAAAGELARQGDHKAAVELWAQAINGDPANSALYCKRGYSYMQLQKEPDAVRDFTICLDLPGCPQPERFQALLCRGMIKRDLGDLTAANADLCAARQAASGPKDGDEAQAQLRLLVERQVAQKRKEKERKEASKPVVHRYGTAIIEEIDDEESMGAQEALVHERVAAWEEVALKTASQARGSAARLARALEAERKRIREANKARTERNAVRAARRREAAERARQAAQQAAQAEQQAQQAKEQAAGQQQQVWVERTRIPIQIVEGASAASGSRSSSSMSESSRSTRSKAAGYESESESESEAAASGAAAVAAGQVAAEQSKQQQQQAAGQPAAAAPAPEPAAPAGSGAGEPAGQEEKTPAEGSPVAVAAAEESQAAADAEDDVINLLESAEALAAAEDARQAALPEEEEEEPEEGQPGADISQAAAAAADSQEAQPFVAPSEQERAAALLTETQLDALKDEADQLQRELKHEAAEERYARYLRLRPSDPRAWSNRAENCMKPGRWQEALEYCNHGLAITTPSHPLSKSKLLSRRGRAYLGLGRLQEALGDFEAAEAGAEAEGDIKLKHDVTKRTARLLREMEAKGIERAPRTAAELGLQGAAAAAQLELPSIPVVPQGPQHEVPESLGVAEEVEGQQKQPKKGRQPAPNADQAAAAAGREAAAEGAAAPQATAEGAAAPQATAAAAEAPTGGAAEPSGAAGSAPAAGSEALTDQKQASVDAKEKGNACFRRHQWRQAVRHYNRAIELDRQNKEALCNKAAALLKLQQWQEAADVAEQALLVDPQYLKARYRKAHAHAGMQDWYLAVINMQIVEEVMRDEGQPMNKEDQRFLAEWRRKQDEAVAQGVSSFAF
ncbi:inactive TPR repeat-containing thioredoxin TTL3-like [Chlorella sorokiniana]|uniref:Inactive TPR repeat-containing thioredoxin TTL3-like n=1 Tax=Chlorella sorokiniana TaxID=3076 RepID=A0A2P6TJK9_CHLSO|nr:inactive TPR repeat-containing thioredoxin TTL3-like [Chlorella sorokiniana]|eukprot:PRW44272.1 inactive TPR repeat-containing thioredoxin TTL3-like [Chlorella sorokiniana]